jgi:hypothetical protein
VKRLINRRAGFWTKVVGFASGRMRSIMVQCAFA